MQTVQPTKAGHATTPSRRPRATLAIAAAIVLVVGAAIAIWAVTSDGEPVAAEDARIEFTFTGDDASYTGDREIVAGRAEIVMVNDGPAPVWFVVQYFEPESTALEAELDRGDEFVTKAMPAGETPIFQRLDPGRSTESIVLEPGTYLIGAARASGDSTHVWQPGVLEVVAD